MVPITRWIGYHLYLLLTAGRLPLNTRDQLTGDRLMVYLGPMGSDKSACKPNTILALLGISQCPPPSCFMSLRSDTRTPVRICIFVSGPVSLQVYYCTCIADGLAAADEACNCNLDQHQGHALVGVCAPCAMCHVQKYKYLSLSS